VILKTWTLLSDKNFNVSFGHKNATISGKKNKEKFQSKQEKMTG
jgi:hypothetical protein